VHDRRETALTLSLASDVDARFTRLPFFTMSLLVGIAFVEEEAIPNGNAGVVRSGERLGESGRTIYYHCS
jgi:hypothetical protein